MGIVGKDIVTVESLIRQIAKPAIEVADAAPLPFLCVATAKGVVQKPRRDELPLGCLCRSQLYRRLGQCLSPLILRHARATETLKLHLKRREGVDFLGKIHLDAAQHLVKRVIPHRPRDGMPDTAQRRPLFAVEDVRLGHLIVSALHERSLHLVLHTFYGERHCDGEIVENSGEDLIHLSAPDLLALSVKRLFHGVENFLLLKGNRLPVSFSDLHFDPLIFSGHFSCPFGQRAGKRSITLARSVFESRFFCSRRGRAVCCLLSWFWLSCQLLHRFQNGVRQCFQLSALVRAHGRGEAEPLVEHRHVLKLIVDEFLHEVTGLHRP